ncbi:MAG: glycosyltransferase family 39 protein [Acidobacteriota bacterium]
MLTLILALRLIHLEADFPPGITWSGALYTDEGWYSNAAVHYALEDTLYVEGEFNPIVVMPVGQLLQVLATGALGLDLSTVRSTSVLSYLLVVLFAALLTRRFAGGPAAAWVALLLATSFVPFAYSRLSLMELPMLALVCGALWLVAPDGPGSRAAPNPRLRTVAAGLVFALALLTKATALFALPLLGYLAWLRGGDAPPGGRPRLRGLTDAALATAIPALIFGGYNLVASNLFPRDAAYFRQLNFDARMTFDPATVVLGAVRAARRTLDLDPALATAAAALLGLGLVFGRSLWRRPPVVLAVAWIALQLGQLAFVLYHPPRYFLTLVVPLALAAVLGAEACATLSAATRRAWGPRLPYVVLAAVVAFNGYRVASYLASPSYSFTEMAHGVEALAERDAGVGGAVVLGNFANTLSLETGLRSVNSELGVEALGRRLDRNPPSHYLTLGPVADGGGVRGEGGEEDSVAAVLRRRYRLEPVGAWDVYGNYYDGKRVHLYRLDPLPSP